MISHRTRWPSKMLAACAASIALLGAPRARSGDLPELREVSFDTQDKSKIKATFWPGPAGGPGVVLLHGAKSDRTAWDRVVWPLRVRGVGVLSVDLRGHGGSRAQGKTDLAPKAEKGDVKLFTSMHQDAIAAVRWLVKEGGCDAKRIAIVGAGIGGCVAVDAAGRYPTEVAAVVALSPGLKVFGLDLVKLLTPVPPTLPMFVIAHKDQAADGATKLLSLRPTTRSILYTDAAQPDEKDAAWATGTTLLAHLPLAAQAVASWVGVVLGSPTDDVVLDGMITKEGPLADPWEKAVDVAVPGDGGTARAYRVGRRIVFGGVAGPGVHGVVFEVQTGQESNEIAIGPPQVVGVDLTKSLPLWSWGAMSSAPRFSGSPAMFGQTWPAIRAVPTDADTPFEGEWFIPSWGDKSDAIRLVVSLSVDPPPRPTGGMVESHTEKAVSLTSR